MNMTWEELDLKLAVQEAQGLYEKLSGELEEGHSDRLGIAVFNAKRKLDLAYQELKEYNENK